MEKYIPYEKLSKKKRKEYDVGKRTEWTICPVTRKAKNPKAYDRNKAQNWKKNFSDSVLFYMYEAKA